MMHIAMAWRLSLRLTPAVVRVWKPTHAAPPESHAMLFKYAQVPLMRSGVMTRDYRLWKRAGVKPGRSYACGGRGDVKPPSDSSAAGAAGAGDDTGAVSRGGYFRVLSVEVVARGEDGLPVITEDEARAAGHESLDACRKAMGKDLKKWDGPGRQWYLVKFEWAGDAGAPPVDSAAAVQRPCHDGMSDGEVDALAAQLRAADKRRAVKGKVLYADILALIDAYPETVSYELSARVGVAKEDNADFKASVRYLKAKGLTVSFERGYRISQAGADFLRRSNYIADVDRSRWVEVTPEATEGGPDADESVPPAKRARRRRAMPAYP